MNNVYILGGGVAGLSAAHELAERGFTLTVFERHDICGGKARSMKNTGSGTGGRADWPGEHGFRFFPGFYWHLSDTMSRIWFDQPNNIRVLDNLVPATEIGIAQENKQPFIIPAARPTTLPEWVKALSDFFQATSLGVPIPEAQFFLKQLLCFLGSGPTRRLQQLEGTPWWDYIGAASRSAQYQAIFGRGLSRSLVAMRPEKASTLTVMSMFVQIVLNIVEGKKADRVLNGPTSDVWIEPWVTQLKSNAHGSNVTILNNHDVQSVTFNPATRRVTSVDVKDAAGLVTSWGDPNDFYISALPIDIVKKTTVLSHALKLAAGLVRPVGTGEDGVDRLETDWMSGVLFYLNRNAAPLKGHVIYTNSTWSLTSVSQRQFWDQRPVAMGAFPWSQRGNGQAVDILSTIISAWDVQGNKAVLKAAKDCVKAEIYEETWQQLKAHLTLAGNGKLNDSDVVDTFLDPAITFDPITGIVKDSLEPLLINTANSRRHRPPAQTNLSNFFVASDYVATNTDLACMEAANEAARQAVNALLQQSGSAAPRCVITPLQEPDVFRFFQAMDELDYATNPAQDPLLCRVVPTLLQDFAGNLTPTPGGTPGGISGALLTQILLSVASVGLLAVIIYLLLSH
jgi:15-cis-phytoene desaturase